MHFLEMEDHVKIAPTHLFTWAQLKLSRWCLYELMCEFKFFFICDRLYQYHLYLHFALRVHPIKYVKCIENFKMKYLCLLLLLV